MAPNRPKVTKPVIAFFLPKAFEEVKLAAALHGQDVRDFVGKAAFAALKKLRGKRRASRAR